MLPRKSSRTQLKLDTASPVAGPGSPILSSSALSSGGAASRLLKKASKPRLRVDSNPSPPSSFPPIVPDASPERVAYTHTSVFRSAHMEIAVQSPSVKLIQQAPQEPPLSLPMFGDRDLVSGTLSLDPAVCGSGGQVTITVEGVFTYVSPVDGTRGEERQMHRHVFHSESITPTSPSAAESSANGSPRSSTVSSIRGALGAIRKRSGSITSRGSNGSSGGNTSPGAVRRYPFSFEIPTKSASGDEFPPTFYTSNVMEGGIRVRSGVETAEVSYRLFALWEAEDGSDDHALLEAPLLIQPDTDWSSLDGLSLEPESWLEVPLKSERSLPFQCALTIASPASFPRAGSIPFYVVFTTTPRSPSLASEIAADATVSVSLARVITVGSGPSPLPPSRPASRAAFASPSIQRDRFSSNRSSSPAVALPHSAFSGVTSSGRGTSPPSSIGSFQGSTGSSSDEADASFLDMPRPPPRLHGRSVRSAPPVLSRAPPPPLFPHAALTGSPLPIPIPPRVSSAAHRHAPTLSDVSQQRMPGSGPRRRAFTETRTLQTDVCVGFPKRPRAPSIEGRKHPTLSEVRTLPDGLYKGRLQLNRNMMPGIEWAGLRIKYYVDVSVLFGQDELRARVPVRIF